MAHEYELDKFHHQKMVRFVTRYNNEKDPKLQHETLARYYNDQARYLHGIGVRKLLEHTEAEHTAISVCSEEYMRYLIRPEEYASSIDFHAKSILERPTIAPKENLTLANSQRLTEQAKEAVKVVDVKADNLKLLEDLRAQNTLMGDLETGQGK